METLQFLHLFTFPAPLPPRLYLNLSSAAGLDLNPPKFAHFLRRSLQKLERYQTHQEGNANARGQQRLTGSNGRRDGRYPASTRLDGFKPAPEVQPAGRGVGAGGC